MVGVALSHWPSLARVIRAEVLQLKNSTYIQVAEKLGHSKIKTALKHMTPHIFPQFLVGLILMFPHAILHEAGITFWDSDFRQNSRQSGSSYQKA